MPGTNKQTIIRNTGGGGSGGNFGTFNVDFGTNTTNIYTQEVIVPEATITTNSKPVVQYYVDKALSLTSIIW